MTALRFLVVLAVLAAPTLAAQQDPVATGGVVVRDGVHLDDIETSRQHEDGEAVGADVDVAPLDYNDSDCLQDCPGCCDKRFNYFWGLCRDPKNPKGSLKHCNPFGGAEAGAELEVSSSDADTAEADVEVEVLDEEVDIAPLDYNDSDCLKDCPNCCAHFGNYFYSLCRDPENPKGSLKHCRPWAGDEAGAEVEVSPSDTGVAEVHAEDERADVDVAPLDYNDSDCLKDCPKCCAHFGNYFYSLCRDPKNPKGSLNYCNPYGEEARHSG